jgi:hypothetical protein
MRAAVSSVPVLALWGERGIIGRCFRPIDEWKRVAADVRGHDVPSGHYIPEEVPELAGGRTRGIFRRAQVLKSHRIAVVAGDGIGKEVVPEGQRCAGGGGPQVRFLAHVGREAVELRVLREGTAA